MSYDITAKVKIINDSQTFGSGFEKRELVLTDDSNDKYPQDILIEFVQDKTSLLDPLKVGQEVTVTFDIRGREYNGRYFNNLQGWKLVAGECVTAPAPDEQPPITEEEDDVPF